MCWPGVVRVLTCCACVAHQWEDDAAPTWETEDHISEEVMREYLDRVQAAKKPRSRVRASVEGTLVAAA